MASIDAGADETDEVATYSGEATAASADEVEEVSLSTFTWMVLLSEIGMVRVEEVTFF